MVLVLVLAAMLAGLVGTVVPVMPGLALIWVAALGAFLVDGPSVARTVVLVLLGGVGVAGTAGKLVLPARLGAAGRVGRGSLAAGLLGGVVGFLVIPVVGFPVGALLGVTTAEQRRLGDWRRAWSVTLEVARSYGLGVAVELGAGLVMVLGFLAAVVVT